MALIHRGDIRTRRLALLNVELVNARIVLAVARSKPVVLHSCGGIHGDQVRAFVRPDYAAICRRTAIGRVPGGSRSAAYAGGRRNLNVAILRQDNAACAVGSKRLPGLCRRRSRLQSGRRVHAFVEEPNGDLHNPGLRIVSDRLNDRLVRSYSPLQNCD